MPESTCTVCDRNPCAPGRDACGSCALARAVGDLDAAEALAIAADAGVSERTARRMLRDERDRQARAELRRLAA